MASAQIFIGTSGWMYKSWNKSFYPKAIKGRDQLPYFAKFFNTAEINSSFYRVPGPASAKRWKAATPDDFQFAVKLNRYLTHSKKLILDERGMDRLEFFLQRIKPLKPKLGALLVQLQPSFRANFGRLDEFLKVLRSKLKFSRQTAVACEFRHDSWFNEEIYKILQRRQAGFVIATLPWQFKPPYPITADTVYIRFHATPEQPDYKQRQLDKWAKYIKQTAKEVKRIFVYCNNDFEGWAITNAKYLKQKLGV